MSSTPYRKVVVPLDGSPLAEQMLDYIKYVTSPTETVLLLISVFDLLRYKSIQLEQSSVKLVAAVLADLERYLNQHREKLERAGYRIHIHVSEGEVAYQIMKLAKDVEAALIAMTTHGRSGFVRTKPRLVLLWPFGVPMPANTYAGLLLTYRPPGSLRRSGGIGRAGSSDL